MPGELGDGLAGLLIASPANPTGTMLARDALAALIDAAAERGIAFVSDEIYHGIQYGARAVSALELSDQVYVVNSFSKYFSMTGWRIGWMVVPEAHVRRVERLMQNLFICAPHASQVAALAALDAEDELQANLAVYRANRALMLERLPRAGFGRIAPPDGAFYVYADVAAMTADSRELAAAHPRRGGRRGHAGARLRPAAGPRHAALLLRRLDRRHRRRAAAAGGLGARRPHHPGPTPVTPARSRNKIWARGGERTRAAPRQGAFTLGQNPCH